MTLQQLLDVPPAQQPPKPPRNGGTEWLAVAGFLIMVVIGAVLACLTLARAIFGR